MMLTKVNNNSFFNSLFSVSPYTYKLLIPFHLIFVLSIYIILKLNLYSLVPYGVVTWVLVSGLGISVGYHRLLSHRSFETRLSIKRLLSYLGCLAGQESPFFWTAVHRGLHHPYSDTQKDPHSPIHGFFWSIIGWQIFFKRSDFNGKIARDILTDPFLRLLTKHYYKVYWGSIIVFFMISWEFTIAAIIPALFVCLYQENVINSICHKKVFGYRNFNINDESVNNIALGLLCWGQGFHNNHHKYPNRFDFGIKWWELDCSKYFVYLLRKKKNA